MRRRELEDYEARERELARVKGAACAPAGFISDIRPLFSDQRYPVRLGVHRSGAPLDVLLLLYPATVIYVPPTTRDQLGQRFGMTVEEVVNLQRGGFVRPIIGHPSDYAGLDHLDELLEMRPPSVWARGDELAHVFADAASFWDEVRTDVPVQEMARIDWVRAKWRRHYPSATERSLTEKIEIELGTNYVDLCVFGFAPLARQIVELGDAAWSARRLLEVNEVATYPQLIGAGGTVNYGIRDAAAIEAAQRDLLLRPAARFLGPEARIITTGLGLPTAPRLDTEALREFHRRGSADRLWKTFSILESELSTQGDTDGDDVALRDAASRAAEAVEAALRESQGLAYELERTEVDKRVGAAAQVFKVAPAAGVVAAATTRFGYNPLAATIAGISVLGGTHVASQLAPIRDRLRELDDLIVDRLMSRKFPPLVTQFWWLRRSSDGQ